MSSKQQNGIARVGIIVALAVVILMVLVWQFTKGSGDDTKTANTTPPTAQPPTPTTPKTTSVDLSKWTEVASPNPDPNEAGKFVFKEGSGNLTVFSTRPIIRYSFRTPAYCAYENEAWVHYIAAGSSVNDYVKDDSSVTCDTVQPTQIAGRNGYMRHAETTGQSTLSVALQQGQEWYVFTVEKTFTTTNLSEADIAAARSELEGVAATLISQALN